MYSKIRLFIAFDWFIGFGLGYEYIDKFIVLNLPFITIMYCLDKQSKGIYIFGKDIINK